MPQDEGSVLRPIRHLSDAGRLRAPLKFAWVLYCPAFPFAGALTGFFKWKVDGMLALFSNKRVLIAFAILTAVVAIALLVVFNII